MNKEPLRPNIRKIWVAVLFFYCCWKGPINLNLLKSYIDALYSFGDSAVIRLKKRQNWEEVAKLR